MRSVLNSHKVRLAHLEDVLHGHVLVIVLKIFSTCTFIIVDTSKYCYLPCILFDCIFEGVLDMVWALASFRVNYKIIGILFFFFLTAPPIHTRVQ